MVLTKEKEIQLLASKFVRSLKKYGSCIDAKSVYFRLSQYDISKQRVYTVRQHVIQSVSTRLLNSPTLQPMNGNDEEEKSGVSKVPCQEQESQRLPRELRQLEASSQNLPSKRNGRT